MKKLFFLLLIINAALYSSNMYTLSGVKKVYPVIEIMTKKVPQEYKEMISEELKSYLDNLNIVYTGHDERAFAILVNSIYISKTTSLINIELLIGEQVKRLDSNIKTFAATYVTRGHFILNKGDDLEDMFEDTLTTLLDKFTEQYEEENKVIKLVEINEDNFALEMKYETSYKEAVKKAKKMKKDIMLVLVANYCPWCRKFEQRVLLKKDVNDIVQKKYIPLIVNKEKDEFPQQFNISFSPVIYFINYETLKSYERIIGYNNKEDFLYFLRKNPKSN